MATILDIAATLRRHAQWSIGAARLHEKITESRGAVVGIFAAEPWV